MPSPSSSGPSSSLWSIANLLRQRPAMISLFLVAPRIFRPLAWTWTARPLCALGRAGYSTSKHDTPTVLTREEALALKKVDSNAYLRYRYATDKNFREKIQRKNRKFRRKPETKTIRIINDYEYNRKIPGKLEGKRSANLKNYREKLELRRVMLLATHILKKSTVDQRGLDLEAA